MSRENISLHRFISADPAICGGRPHIAGTRIAVELVGDHVMVGHTLEQIQRSYPHLSLDQIRAAIEYNQMAGNASEPIMFPE